MASGKINKLITDEWNKKEICVHPTCKISEDRCLRVISMALEMSGYISTPFKKLH